MKLALCDDNIGQIHILSDAVRNCSVWSDIEVSISTFSSGKELIDSVSSGEQYDYIFLDIEMPELSGFDVCAEIQQLCDCPIVFVSTHIELLPEAFTLKPYGFLSKPYNQDTFDRTVKSVIAQTVDRKFYNYINDGKNETIDVKSILYFDISDYVLKMHLFGGTYLILPRKRLDEVESELRDFGFFRCNRSTLVNLYHCSGRNLNRLIIRHTDAVIDISRRKTQEFDKRLILFKMGDKNAF